MLESYDGKYVRNYTSNYDIKELIQEVLIPNAFPDIPVNKLNLGFPGIVSEEIGRASCRERVSASV